SRLPPARTQEIAGPVEREAARRDQRPAVEVLRPLVEPEAEQILDVAPALPRRADAARDDEAARGCHVGAVHGGEKSLDGVLLEDRVGVDSEGELSVDARERRVLGARL